MYFMNGERWLFYKEKLKEVDGQTVAGEPLTSLWDDLYFLTIFTMRVRSVSPKGRNLKL